MNSTEERYYSYLCSLVCPQNGGGSDCTNLYILRRLWKREFWSMTPNDDNRASDGLVLREVYRHDTGDDLVYSLGPCRMLEMMISLADRMRDVMTDIVEDNTVERWFWEMVQNLGLIGAEGEGVDISDEVDAAVDRVLERRYSRDGKGGLFPTKRFTGDQRRVELWYQMQQYLMENY